MMSYEYNCEGKFVRIDSNQEGKALYEYYDVNWNNGIAIRDVASVLVPPGYELHFYEDVGQEGEKRVIRGKPYDDNGMMVC
jgi:hypothetical protein